MPFTSQEIFLFIALVPLLVIIGRKLRGDAKPKAENSNESSAEKFSAEIRRKIENGFYNEGNSVLLAAFDSDVEANIVRGLLLDNDIYAEIRDEMMGATKFNYSYAVGGVKIYVHEREFADAEFLLKEHSEIAGQATEDWKIRTCPACGSDMLTYQKFHPLSALLLFSSVPFLPLRAGRWVCLKCRHKWREPKR